MAGVSLGDAVLAFAGGAAGAYNEEINRQRESDSRMMERAQEMMMKQKARIAETKFATEYAEKVKYDQIYKRVQSAGGMESPWGQHIYATEYMGLPPEIAVKMISSGQGSNWTFQKPERTPEGHMEDLLGNISVSTRKGREQLEGLRREQDKIRERQFSTHPVDTADIEEMKAGTGIYSSSAFDKYRELFAPKEEPIKIGKDDRLLVKDPSSPTGYKEIVSPVQKPAESPWKAEVTKDDRVIWTNKETQEVKVDDTAFNPSSEDEIRYSTVMIDGISKEVMNVMKKGPDGNYIVSQQIDLGDKPIRDYTTAQGRKAAKEELFIAGEVMNTVTRMERFIDIKQARVGGVITDVQGALVDLYQSIPGLPVSYYEEGKNPDATTLSTYLSQEFTGEDKERAADFFERRMAQGKEQVLETLLIYNYARLQKPEGKLNVDDISRVENMLKKGASGGIAMASAIGEIRSTAQAKARARISEFVRQNNVSGFDGSVVYDPQDMNWKYRVTVDGESSWKAID